ncbi:hypothetical protein RBB73_05100 [Tunturiibacter empetritectus]
MTLAAFAAEDNLWSEFDNQWLQMLSTHLPAASYIHMKELAHQQKAFGKELGWDDKSAFGLAIKCLMYMQTLDKKRFRMFYCAVDLKAWRRLKALTFDLVDPIDICNTCVPELVLDWYAKTYPSLTRPGIDVFKYYFDRGELFLEAFKRKWIAERDRPHSNSELNLWSLVESVNETDMRLAPGIQAADMLAWSHNRETRSPGSKGNHLCHLMRTVIPSLHIIWDEAKLRQTCRPLIYLPPF